MQITQSQIALIKMLNKNGAHQAKRKNGLGRGKGVLGAKKKKKVANNKNMFPCIFRFRFFCYNKLKHIFTLLSGFCHFSLFFPFSQHATPPPPLYPFVFVGHANFPCEFTLTCVKVIVSNFALSIGVRYEYQSSPTMFSKQRKKACKN